MWSWTSDCLFGHCQHHYIIRKVAWACNVRIIQVLPNICSQEWQHILIQRIKAWAYDLPDKFSSSREVMPCRNPRLCFPGLQFGKWREISWMPWSGKRPRMLQFCLSEAIVSLKMYLQMLRVSRDSSKIGARNPIQCCFKTSCEGVCKYYQINAELARRV